MSNENVDMNSPYRELFVESPADPVDTRTIEERIRDNHIDRLAYQLSAYDYSIDPISFREMVQRLGAKIELDDSRPFVTLHFGATGASARVYPDPDAPRGLFQPHDPPLSPPAGLENPIGITPATSPVTETYEDAAEGPVIVDGVACQRHDAIIHAIENLASLLSMLLDEVRELRNESNR